MIHVGGLLNKRYKILRELKPGGFSRIFEVWDARQHNLKNGFGLLRGQSIKILKVFNHFDNRQQDAEFLFRREIGLLKQLDHPAVVQYTDDFDLMHDQRIIPCLVMEKVPGVTMEKWLQQNGSVSEEVAIDWLLQFVEVLNYLHNNQRIMHLDIKPANVMVTPRGELVLIDFGIARPISSTLLAKLVDSGESIQHRAATDWFSAPEQLQGKPTPTSDFYSLGRTLIVALTNQDPSHFVEDDEGNLMWHEFAFHISLSMQNLLDKMTAYNVVSRLANGKEIVQILIHIQSQTTKSSGIFFSLLKKIIGGDATNLKAQRWLTRRHTKRFMNSAFVIGFCWGIIFCGTAIIIGVSLVIRYSRFDEYCRWNEQLAERNFICKTFFLDKD